MLKLPAHHDKDKEKDSNNNNNNNRDNRRPRSFRIKSGLFVSQMEQQYNSVEIIIQKEESILLYSSTAILHLALNGNIKVELIESSSLLEAILCFLNLYQITPAYSASPISIQVQMNGCCIVAALIQDNPNIKSLIMGHVLPLFINLLSYHSHTNQNITLKAAEVLVELSGDGKYITQGGLNPLITLCLSEDSELQRLASDALLLVSSNPDHCDGMLKDGCLLPIISLIWYSASDPVEIHAIQILINLAKSSVNHADLILREGILLVIQDLFDSKINYTSSTLEIIKNIGILLEYLAVTGNPFISLFINSNYFSFFRKFATKIFEVS